MSLLLGTVVCFLTCLLTALYLLILGWCLLPLFVALKLFFKELLFDLIRVKHLEIIESYFSFAEISLGLFNRWFSWKSEFAGKFCLLRGFEALLGFCWRCGFRVLCLGCWWWLQNHSLRSGQRYDWLLRWVKNGFRYRRSEVTRFFGSFLIFQGGGGKLWCCFMCLIVKTNFFHGDFACWRIFREADCIP